MNPKEGRGWEVFLGAFIDYALTLGKIRAMGWRADATWSSRRLLPLYPCLVGFGEPKVYQVCPLDAIA